MAEIRWTEQALDDVEAIADFIARDSPRYAQVFASRISEAVDRLRLFPASGRVVPEIGAEHVREIIVGNYRVVYSCKNDAVAVLLVFHGARLMNLGDIEIP